MGESVNYVIVKVYGYGGVKFDDSIVTTHS